MKKFIIVIAVLLAATSCEQPITLRLKHTIDFNLNYEGAVEAPPNQRLEPGSHIAKPSDPVRADFTFAGWYCEQGCLTAWDFSADTVKKSMTLFAKWLYESPPVSMHSVTFNVNHDGSTNAPADQTISEGGHAVKPDPDPARDGFEFGGWYTEPDCVTPWDFSADTVTKPMTLFAKWIVPLNGSSISITMTGGLPGDYSVTFTLVAGMPIDAPDTSGAYPVFTIPRSALPLAVSITSTPVATDYSWLFDGDPIGSNTSSIQLTTLDLSPAKHNLTVLLAKDADPYRSAAIVLDTTD